MTWSNKAHSLQLNLMQPNKNIFKKGYKMSLEHLVLPKIKEVLKKQTKKLYNDEDVSKKYKSQLRELPMAKGGTIWTTKC